MFKRIYHHARLIRNRYIPEDDASEPCYVVECIEALQTVTKNIIGVIKKALSKDHCNIGVIVHIC
jgi:hypothetical protein